jgi:hypothetical protein
LINSGEGVADAVFQHRQHRPPATANDHLAARCSMRANRWMSLCGPGEAKRRV